MARIQAAAASHPQDSLGHLLHRITTLIIISGTAFSSILLHSTGFAADSARSPNIVLILADDQSPFDIFYTADHGIAIGRHGLQGKQNLYEHTWRVPFIVKGPGIQAGSRVKGNIYLLDVLATLCDLAGIDPPESNEGLSFRPVLEGRRQSMRDVLYGVYCGGTKPGMRAVKQGDWKLIKYDVLGGQVRQTQLFNLAENPYEFLEEHRDPKVAAASGISPDVQQRNLAGDPRYAEKLAELEALLLAEMRRLDDPYRLWNQPDDGLPAADATRR